ncbi:DUF5710 domain-containing protein [Actinomycetospora straminea]|uniref:DUF5710 domain-containing protein n=1 Tax=Actinomycetospora straminea TaxID=663607 RepID=UPI0023657A14|nr:DUF5710 domain-containing protein [Actinomycetospora straminea]MDD7935521.1 DUF5710 domain-containing protein [Actinomycetospora straminea]
MVREQQPWLDVPFGEKDEAKAAGALWDWRAKRWYAPRPGMAELAPWLPGSRDAGVPAESPGSTEPPETSGASSDGKPAVRPSVGAPWRRDDGAARTGASVEARLAAALNGLTESGPLARLTRRRPPWRVLHGVPVGPGSGEVDHVLVGPPGVVTVRTAHHPGAAVRVDGDHLTVDDEVVDHVSPARAEAERASRLLAAARGDAEAPPATAALAVVAASVATAPGGTWPRGVLLAVPANLPRRITSLPTALADDEIDELYAVARRLGTWTREL